jgi:putative transposase
MKTLQNRNIKISELTQQQVHQMALETLKNNLNLSSTGEKSSEENVLNILLSAAANRTSIDRECDELEGAPSPNTVRGVLRDSLELQMLERQLNQSLGQDLNRVYWRNPQHVAVDLVDIPYYGLAKDDPNEVRRSQAKLGTTYFHVFATAYVIRKHRRVTLALHYVRQGETLVNVLDVLKGRLDELGIKVGLWMADRAFCSVSCLRWFDQQPEAIIPMMARGKKSPPSASRKLFEFNYSHWDTYTMNSDRDGEFTFPVAIVHQNSRLSRSKHKLIPPRTLVYAVVGKRVRTQTRLRSLTQICALYHERFGIESSYRQLNQARMRTSSRSPELRLLAVGIAFLLRNLWALCAWMTLAHKGSGARAGESQFRFHTLLRWIASEVESRLLLRTTIPLPAPSQVCF